IREEGAGFAEVDVKQDVILGFGFGAGLQEGGVFAQVVVYTLEKGFQFLLVGGHGLWGGGGGGDGPTRRGNKDIKEVILGDQGYVEPFAALGGEVDIGDLSVA